MIEEFKTVFQQIWSYLLQGSSWMRHHDQGWNTRDGMKIAHAQNLFRIRCPEIVGGSVALLEEILKHDLKKCAGRFQKPRPFIPGSICEAQLCRDDFLASLINQYPLQKKV